MKKLILISVLSLITLYGLGQATITPAQTFRVYSKSATIGAKLPVGTKIILVSSAGDFNTWVTTMAVDASSKTLDQLISDGKVKLDRTEVHGGKGINVNISDTGIVYVTAKTGLATDSLLKVESTLSTGNWLQANSTGVIGKTDAQLKTALGVGAAKVEYFSAENDSVFCPTPPKKYTFQLAQTPISGSINVELNGVNLKITDQWSVIMTNKVRVLIPVYQYDNVNISYTY